MPSAVNAALRQLELGPNPQKGADVVDARTWAQYLPSRTRARKCARMRALRAHLGQVPVRDMNTPKTEGMPASLTQFLLGNSQFAWLLPGSPKCHLPRQNLLAMRAMVKVTTRTIVALSIDIQ